MNKKRIDLIFHLEQVCNDVLTACNNISKNIRDEGLDDIKASVQTPDDAENRSIINRAVTEAFGRVKVACQRYLTVGRTFDDNSLERLVKNITYKTEERVVQDTDDDGHLLYSLIIDGTDQGTVYEIDGHIYNAGTGIEVVPTDPYTLEPKMVVKEVQTDEVESITYEDVYLVLEIENFNIAVTDDLKSSIHKFVVDYVLSRFLQNFVAEKADEYKALADGEDYRKIVSDLNCREKYTMRKPSFM